MRASLAAAVAAKRGVELAMKACARFGGLVAILLTCLVAGSLAGCAKPAELPPVPAYRPAALRGTTWKAVLVAGDGHVPAFDNAVDRIERRLEQGAGVPSTDIRRLSSAPEVVARDGVAPAARDRVLRAIEAMRPGPGQGCFVFATSHGVRGRGLYLSTYNEVLDPASLDRALAEGCGNAPTVVIVSGCYSGSFAKPPMARDNRIVLTASREDRVSFGCGAENVTTDYDACLLQSLGGGTWRDVYARIQPCVAAREQRGRFPPSRPQAWFGAAVADMPVPALGG